MVQPKKKTTVCSIHFLQVSWFRVQLPSNLKQVKWTLLNKRFDSESTHCRKGVDSESNRFQVNCIENEIWLNRLTAGSESIRNRIAFSLKFTWKETENHLAQTISDPEPA